MGRDRKNQKICTQEAYNLMKYRELGEEPDCSFKLM